MRNSLFPAALLVLATGAAAQDAITTETLLFEMGDMARLARWPAPAYRTVQYSSYDRRSTSPEAPGWFENSDGFGKEPVPGFEAVLKAPDAEGVGTYLLCDVPGPGAIVRGWSAGMGGTLRVFLDGAGEPIWEGSAYDFLARRSAHFLERAGLELESGDAFVQQDADYLPIPFAKRLRVTWKGKLAELHFYHLQVRLYAADARVQSFDFQRDIAGGHDALAGAIRALTEPSNALGGEEHDLSNELAQGARESHELVAPDGGGAIAQLAIKVAAPQLDKALRGVVMRLYFDGSSHPQVECPLGDFFGSGPGVNPYSSLPLSVHPDGLMVSRWVMPFARGARIEFQNWSTAKESVTVRCRAAIAPWRWDARSMYFRLKWRVEHDLLGGPGELVRDMPFLVAQGRGQLVGLASILMNPTGIPTPWGSWWGEGDEKIFVDDENLPVAFGTGSEDYYNYSWSRPDLFDHPYCGQPLDSGPGNSGYVSNHRWQIMDAIPFERALAAYMELYPHTRTPGMSYACLAYHYARPGCRDDHRTLTPAEAIVPPLPPREAAVSHGSRNSTIHYFDALRPRVVGGGALERQREPLAMRGRVVAWQAAKGGRLEVRFEVLDEAWYRSNMVLLHRPDGAVLRLLLDGQPLHGKGGEERISLRTEHQKRDLAVEVAERRLAAGEHTLVLECVEPGFVGLDFMWIQRTRSVARRIAGVIEAEDLKVLGETPGLPRQKQDWSPPIFSAGYHLWVRARGVGEWIELEIPVSQPGRYRLSAWLTRSWDYGRLRFSVEKHDLCKDFNAFNGGGKQLRVEGPVELGILEVEGAFALRVEVTGTHPDTEKPHYLFGIDCLKLERID